MKNPGDGINGLVALRASVEAETALPGRFLPKLARAKARVPFKGWTGVTRREGEGSRTQASNYSAYRSIGLVVSDSARP